MAGKVDFPASLRDSKEGNKVAYQQDAWANGSGYATGGYSHNHKGHEVVWEDKATGKKLYGSNMHSIDEFSDRWDLFIDLASIVRESTYNTSFVKKPSSRFGVLNKFTTQKAKKMKMEHLPLDWPDMAAPPATLDFWITLWEMLPEKTVVACMGGHGRTGSCLVALMIAAGVDYYTALSWVRTKHCVKAVETLSQEQYLHTIYCEMLKRHIEASIEAEEPAKNLAELQEALGYALENPPTFQNTKAVKSGGGGTTHTYGNGSSSSNVTAGTERKGFTYYWLGSDHYRQDSAGFVDIEECTDPKCNVMNCQTKKHMEWNPYGQLSADGKKIIPFYSAGGTQDHKLPTI